MNSQSSSKSSTSPATRILVAEDETLIRMDLVEMLTEAGYEVIAQATNGEEAITLANEHKPDLAILGKDHFYCPSSNVDCI
jgi:response regulator NasT